MSDLMAERAVLLRQVAELRAEVAGLRAEMAVPDEVPDQDWASLDGAVAWHLIDRHAEGWADIGRQMDLWLAARSAAAVAALQAQVEALRAELRASEARLFELRALMDRRPALNAGTLEAYVRWTQEAYKLDWLSATDTARKEG